MNCRIALVACVLCAGVCFADGGDEVPATELRRSLDEPADQSPAGGAADPKLVPIALTMVGLLAAIGAGTLIGTIIVRRRSNRSSRGAE